MHMKPVMGAISPIMGPALGDAGLVTIVMGIILTLRVQGTNHLDKFYSDGWGYAITIGFVTSVVALALGGMTGVTANRMTAVGKEIGDGPPTPEQGAELAQLSGRLRNLSRIVAVLVLIALGSMASARFV